MTTAPRTTDGITDADPVNAVLLTARRHQAAAQTAEAALLVTAVDWAVLHPAETSAQAATYTLRRDDTDLRLAGPGTPLIDDWCVAEFAAALRLSTEAGQRLIGEAVELRYRLPRLWWLVQAGLLPAWQARRVGAQTITLSVDAAAFVDRNTAVRAGRIGPVILDRLIAEAIARSMPDEAARRQAERAERRCFDIDHRAGDDGLAGQSIVYGVLDLPDALDLDAAISDGARLLANVGDTACLDVRRARAAGDLARRQPCLDLNDFVDDTTPNHHQTTPISAEVLIPSPTRRNDRGPKARPARSHHAPSCSTCTCPTGPSAGEQTEHGSGGCKTPSSSSSPSRSGDWVGQPGTHLVVKPVIDLNDAVAVEAYEIPDRIRERVTLRHPTCVFPWCHQPSYRTDLDHRIPYDTTGPPGQTSTYNLTPLCRRHHRLKTFTRWRYRPGDQPGCYVWISPHGLRLLRDHTGTTEIGAGDDS